ncbi:MAG: hypothetical protein V4725_02360 [Bacteroidota bacterium]
MEKFFVLLLFMVVVGSASGQQFKPVDNGSAVSFVIKNFGLNINGRIGGDSLRN